MPIKPAATSVALTDTLNDVTQTHADTAAEVAADVVASQQRVVMGKISGQHGIKGWIRVHSYTRPLEQILEYDRWLLAAHPDSDAWQSVTLTEVRWQAKKLLAKLDGVDDRNAADSLAGKWIAVHSSQLAQLPKGEYYWSDLIGLLVVNQDGVELGMVEHLVETGANDVLAVRPVGAAADDASARLLPWSPTVIRAVDINGGCIRVEWAVDD